MFEWSQFRDDADGPWVDFYIFEVNGIHSWIFGKRLVKICLIQGQIQIENHFPIRNPTKNQIPRRRHKFWRAPSKGCCLNHERRGRSVSLPNNTKSIQAKTRDHFWPNTALRSRTAFLALKIIIKAMKRGRAGRAGLKENGKNTLENVVAPLTRFNCGKKLQKQQPLDKKSSLE